MMSAAAVAAVMMVMTAIAAVLVIVKTEKIRNCCFGDFIFQKILNHNFSVRKNADYA